MYCSILEQEIQTDHDDIRATRIHKQAPPVHVCVCVFVSYFTVVVSQTFMFVFTCLNKGLFSCCFRLWYEYVVESFFMDFGPVTFATAKKNNFFVVHDFVLLCSLFFPLRLHIHESEEFIL